MANPKLAAPIALVGLVVACVEELEESFPGFTTMLIDETMSCSTAAEFHLAIQKLSQYDEEISIGGVLFLAQTE